MLTKRFARAKDAFYEQTPEGLVVMGANGQILKFNGVGEFLWSLLDGRQTVAGLIDAVMAEYEAPSVEQVTHDVEAFIHYLLEQQLLEQEGEVAWPG